MVDRQELGETERGEELVPGKVVALYRYAQVLRDRATDVIADAEALKRIDTGAWTGPAYEAYAEDNANQWPRWLKLGDAMAYGAQAVESYANCLGWAQMQANQAVELYRRGQQLSQQAQQSHDKAVAAYNSGGGESGALPPVFQDPGEEYRQAARELLERARRQLEAVAGESAKALNEMAEAVPTEDEESTAETLAHAATDAAGFIPVIGDAVDLAHAGVYALQGRGTEAALTAAAAVPFAGWAAGGTKLGKAGTKIGEALGIGEKARFGWSDRIGRDAYRANFFDANPDLKGKVWVHHAVEQQAMKKQYPELDISPNEMHSLDNLRGIPKEINGDVHLRKIRSEWDEFYIDNPNPSKQDLLDKATEIDNRFGHQFNPPVR
ncbi:putative T7SS-secreted protein [Saccharopolyspora endophytica]|uniref:Putative T7SS secretion signal domain-containing protein n=1 Tax=Saccharopolyspora endophytica TaxID=543886 RepID=A0ABS5DH52_9PSEU|nr:hypothetical protein [Saccharopolyspora endophytica]MBQ0925608.1 hypothetical protein [Saccharopolyspora endophytica]